MTDTAAPDTASSTAAPQRDLAPLVVRREPAANPDQDYADRVAAFVAAHPELLATDRWEDPAVPPVRELIGALGAAGLLRAAWPAATPEVDGRSPRCLALGRAIQLHTAFAQVANGAPGAAVLTQLEVGTRLLTGHPELLDGLLDGTVTVSLAATEPDGGSDLSTLTTRVGRDGERLTVTGEKWFISNAPFADLLLVLAEDPEQHTGPRPGPALLLVDTRQAGAGEVEVTALGGSGHTGLTGSISLRSAPVRAVLAPAGQGLLTLMRHWIHERVMLTVRMTALAQAVLDDAVSGARHRSTFGSPLLTNQHVRFLLAELSAEVAEVRSAALQGVRLLVEGGCTAAYAAMCKYRASVLLRRVADEAIQLAGADGYRTGHPAERALRDGFGLALAGGTDELMLMQIERG
ncbi:alkylation response protein AidB-like acyl-CoA dehydrogenase [Kitasatospora gansuensis]|uniref:Alkylation response protein AidB-like acyl-CoA dehydrogenase n=1 Tax=Kitasatospora gansuensis TaxID=258050 RepID=A0A7W7SCM8_9ACTN|nr:acyl-CoA dehydrogenase [Kitasatospora gansuensis]MBB4948020.1 alkylation response protein AidB-like acyl-CoA dehydrogenase [Kitasatospora gansuensis]